MNKIITTIVIIICSITAIQASDSTVPMSSQIENTVEPNGTTTYIDKRLAAKGYRGFVNYTPLTATFINEGISGSISTTHGYQLNHHLFIGAGAGFHINLGDKGFGIAIPVYAAIKGNVGKHLAQFTYGARVGASYADYSNFNSETSHHNGETALAYLNVNLGLRLGIARYFAIRLTPEVDIFAGKYNIVGVGLRLGFEF